MAAAGGPRREIVRPSHPSRLARLTGALAPQDDGERERRRDRAVDLGALPSPLWVAESNSPMSALDFVHLHVHSAYSLLEGALPIKRLAELAKADRQPALAIADTGNLFGALEFSEKMVGSRHPADRRLPARGRFRRHATTAPRNGRAPSRERARVVLIAASEAGYCNLVRLFSRAFLDTPANEPPHAHARLARRRTDGLIALTGGPGGPIDRAIAAGQSRAGRGAARRARGAVRRPALCRDCSATAAPAQRRREPELIELAYAHGLPLVATNEPFFADARRLRGARRADLHRRGRLVIAETDRRRLTPEHYFKTPRRDGGAVRRPARGARQHRRDRPALRLVRPRTRKPILPRFAGRRGRQRARRPRSCAGARETGLDAPARRRTASRPASPRTNTASGWTSSSASSSR